MGGSSTTPESSEGSIYIHILYFILISQWLVLDMVYGESSFFFQPGCVHISSGASTAE